MELINFDSSQRIRAKLTLEQQKEIKALYRRISKQLSEKISKLQQGEKIFGVVNLQYLASMKNNIDKELDRIEKYLDSSIPTNMEKMVETVIKDNADKMGALGLDIRGAFSSLPASIVESIISGQLYNTDWSLSKAIWRHTKKSKSDINTIIAEGIALNKSTYDIAKDLEKYVNPSAKKPWDWSKMYPGTNKVVDYNAQRLANTMISHAYQQAFVQTTKDNPFFDAYRWNISNSHREVCEICKNRAQEYHGVSINGKMMRGVYRKDELPIDHPNGQCTVSLVMSKSMDDVVNDIANWYKSPEGTYPKIDKFVKQLEV